MSTNTVWAPGPLQSCVSLFWSSFNLYAKACFVLKVRMSACLIPWCSVLFFGSFVSIDLHTGANCWCFVSLLLVFSSLSPSLSRLQSDLLSLLAVLHQQSLSCSLPGCCSHDNSRQSHRQQGQEEELKHWHYHQPIIQSAFSCRNYIPVFRDIWKLQQGLLEYVSEMCGFMFGCVIVFVY